MTTLEDLLVELRFELQLITTLTNLTPLEAQICVE